MSNSHKLVQPEKTMVGYIFTQGKLHFNSGTCTLASRACNSVHRHCKSETQSQSIALRVEWPWAYMGIYLVIVMSDSPNY